MQIRKQLLTILMVLALIPISIFAQAQEASVKSNVKNDTLSILRVEAKNVGN